MKRLIGLLMVAATLLLASCGGGGGCAGTPTNGTNTCGSTATPTGKPAVASFVYTLDKGTILNTGGDQALLTITALDASRNVITGVPITVSLSSGTYVQLVAITDASGQVKGNITIGGDYSNRPITATFTDGAGVSGTASVVVTGSKIAFTVLPASPAPSTSVDIGIKATNANGVGIAGASLQVTGLSYTGTLITDASGNATVTTTSPATAGSYTVTAVGLGITATQTVLVSGGAGVIPNAVGPISAANLSINPNTIAPNATGTTTNRAALKAVFQNASNQAIQNVRVRFEIVAPGLGSGEQISTGTSTVYSDASGIATADYISGTRASPTNGVNIRACYGLTDADIAGTLCPNSVPASMTVASQPISVSLGSNNELAKSNSNLTYVQKLVVMVNDSAGLAVPGAIVSASVDITHYGKGWGYNDPYYVNGLTQPLITPPAFGEPGINSTDVPVAPTVTWNGTGQRVWCINEDLNRNGLLDGGEDINGSTTLEPRKADVTISYVSGNSTGADGAMLLQVQYPQNVATWLAFTVKVTTSVGGTEGTDQKSFWTSYVKGDESNGSFLTTPFGKNNCVTDN